MLYQPKAELLHMRQEQGSKLRVSVDRTDSMTDEELNELRIDIKVGNQTCGKFSGYLDCN